MMTRPLVPVSVLTALLVSMIVTAAAAQEGPPRRPQRLQARRPC